MSENEVDWSVVLKNLKDECFRSPVLKPFWEQMLESAIMLCAGRSRRAWDKEIGGFRELPESDKALEDQYQAEFDKAKKRLIEECQKFGLDPPNFQASDICETFVR